MNLTFGRWNKYAIIRRLPFAQIKGLRYFRLLFFHRLIFTVCVYTERKYTEKEYPIFESSANTGYRRDPDAIARSLYFKFDEFLINFCATGDSEVHGKWKRQGSTDGQVRKENAGRGKKIRVPRVHIEISSYSASNIMFQNLDKKSKKLSEKQHYFRVGSWSALSQIE